MRSVISRPSSLRRTLISRIRSRTRFSRRSSSSSSVESATETTSSSAITKPSTDSRSPRMTSSAASSSPAARTRPSSSSSYSPAARAPETSRSFAPSRGPSSGRFGFSWTRATGPSSKSTSLTFSSSAISSSWPAGERGAAHEHAPERLAQRNARLSARLVPELDDPPHLGHLGQHRRVRLGRLGPAGEVHRRRRALAGAAHEVLPQVLGEERHQRRDQAQRLHDRPPERPERARVVGVEARPRAADVPVGQVVDVALERVDDAVGQELLVGLGRLGHELRACARRASGRADAPAPARPRRRGVNPSAFAESTRNLTEFQKRRKRRLISCAGP